MSTTEIERSAEESFRHYDAEDINTSPGHVSGWVPKQNLDPLTNEVDGATVQYYTDDGYEAFVTTL